MNKLIVTRYVLLSLIAVLFAGCEDGDPTALNDAFTIADLNIVSIAVEPANGTIQDGFDYPFTATGTRPDGSTVDVTNSVTWGSSNTTVATVGSNGVVDTKVLTATDPVDVTISATIASISGTAQLTVSPADLTSIEVNAIPSSALEVSSCGRLQLEAIGIYTDGRRDIIPITQFVTWEISTGPGKVNDLGLVTATSDSGAIDVLTSLSPATPVTTSITILQDLQSIAVTPSTPRIGVGETLQFTATGSFVGGSTAVITEGVTWATNPSPSDIATFQSGDPNGLVTGLSAGNVPISAACGSVTPGAATLAVSEEILDYLRFEYQGNELNNVIDINLDDSAVAVELIAHFTDGSRRTVTENAQWSVINNSGGIIFVDDSSGNKGEITPRTTGTGYVQADYGQREKLLIVNVFEPIN